MFFFKVLMFLTAKVAANPKRYVYSEEEYTRILERLSDNLIEVMERGPKGLNTIEQINSSLSDLVHNASTDIVILFNILLWTSILAVNTLPVVNDSLSSIIHPNIAPYKVYLLTSAYALLLGAAATSTYNLLDGLADSAQWGLLSISILWLIVSCIRSPFLLSVIDNLERPHGVISRLGHIKYLVYSAWANKLGIVKKILKSHNFWFLLISICLGFGLNFGGSNLPDSLGHKEQLVPRDIPCNVSNSPNMDYVHVFVFLATAVALIYLGHNHELLTQAVSEPEMHTDMV